MDIVRRRFGLRTIDEIDESMTLEQIELYLHWEMRDQARQATRQQYAIRQALQAEFKG